MATHLQAIQICLTVLQGSWNDTSATARAVDESGLHSIGIADSPMHLRDMHLACAACALNTSKTKIITGVTNPVTRHPSVMASAFLQLEELAPERIICGIATGDSALWGVGLKPAKLAELREYTAVHRRLRTDRHDAVMVAQIHDELILEANAQDTDAVGGLLAEEMTRAFTVTFPEAPSTDLVGVKTGSSWADLK